MSIGRGPVGLSGSPKTEQLEAPALTVHDCVVADFWPAARRILRILVDCVPRAIAATMRPLLGAPEAREEHPDGPKP